MRQISIHLNFANSYIAPTSLNPLNYVSQTLINTLGIAPAVSRCPAATMIQKAVDAMCGEEAIRILFKLGS